MITVLIILLIASSMSVFFTFLLFWWLVPGTFLLTSFLTDSSLIFKIVLIFLLLGFNIHGALMIGRLVSMMSDSVYKKIFPALNVAHFALSAIYIVVFARLLFPIFGVFSFVPASQIPLYFCVIALCSTVTIVRNKMSGISVIGKERFDYRHHFIGPSAQELMAKDERPPILYLRSFNKELLSATWKGRMSYLRKFFDRSLYMHSGIKKLDFSLIKRHLRTDILNANRSLFDEQLIFASFFTRIGPYVAIGRPGETFGNMDVGAAKMYVTDGEWQNTILNLLKISAAIVLEAGDSEGLLWEIEQITTHIPARKFLIILPASDMEYQAFRTFAEHAFPMSLPKEWVRSRLIIFEDDWTPIELENVNFSVAAALTPFCQRNGFTLDI